MPLPNVIQPVEKADRVLEACRVADWWTLDATLAQMLVAMVGDLSARFAAPRFRGLSIAPKVVIFSGYRSQSYQAEINPAVTRSCHVQCPSMAVDLRLGTMPGLIGDEVYSIYGVYWQTLGGRWGGNFSHAGPELINPAEKFHFDLGPCL
jgi:hypothetical protein